MPFCFALLAAIAISSESANAPPAPPGLAYAVPQFPQAEGAPLVYSHTADAGPDQSFLLVGERLTGELIAWGPHPDAAGGRQIRPKVYIASDHLLVAMLPEQCYDGPIVVWAKNPAGYSEPVVLNAPQPWWCQPEAAGPGDTVRIFGRNLAVRPDFARAIVCLGRAGMPAQPLKVVHAGKYQLHVELPQSLEPGQYQIWVHAGNGGEYGWGEPLSLTIRNRPVLAPGGVVTLDHGDVQQAVDRLAAAGGGTVRLAEGIFDLPCTLIVPDDVKVEGAAAQKTLLISPPDPAVPLATISTSGWNQGPSAVHTPGDRIVYKVQFPAAGPWTVWLRYATEMSPYKLPGVSKHMVLSVDGGEPVPLDHLPNTGSFGTFKWSRSAVIQAPAGTHEVAWTNAKGGGIHIDALVFARGAEYAPTDNPLPVSGPEVVVVQAEDAIRFETKEGKLPGTERAAVWLAGRNAAISDLTIRGSPRTNLGIAVRSPKFPAWVEGCRVSGVRVCGCEGKRSENCGIRLFHADGAMVTGNEFWGRAPIMLSGVQRSCFASNRLVSQTLWGGNAEAYILGRNETGRKCIVEDNVCACPPGDEAGGPTGRRMLWFSTGRGSVDLNWIAGNREDRARFGGVADTDQNVGEMILFESCERIAYHGPLAAADARSVTLPARLEPTPDDRLGSVQRGQLAHDAAGNETPFWPPEVDQGTGEGPASEYFVTILRGRGLGQTRRVVARQGETYQLDRPWRVAPQPGGLVLVHTAYYRNHIVGNRVVDGMTGIQLWIACIENIVSGNVVERMRKPGLYLYGNCTTLASSMPATWNRGIGPLYFNQIEGTRCDETSSGAVVLSGEMHNLPVEFPRCLGNVLRHNSFVRSRSDGLVVTGQRPAGERQPSQVVQGTIAEFNLVRDATTGYHVAQSAEATLLRRNHAYFWYPVNLQPGPRVAFQVDDPQATAVVEQNTVEGINGVPDGQVIVEQRGPKK